jgi:hypothetical protein
MMKQINGTIMMRKTILFAVFFALFAACIKLFLLNLL